MRTAEAERRVTYGGGGRGQQRGERPDLRANYERSKCMFHGLANKFPPTVPLAVNLKERIKARASPLVPLVCFGKKQVMATAFSNVAADNLLEGVLRLGLRAVRIGRPATVRPALWDATLDAMVEKHPGVVGEPAMEDDVLIGHGYAGVHRVNWWKICSCQYGAFGPQYPGYFGGPFPSENGEQTSFSFKLCPSPTPPPPTPAEEETHDEA